MNKAEQPQHEKLKSFDPLASVDMARFDLEQFGHILPETRERIYDEELSYIAEGIDRASRTAFCLQRDSDGQLVYFDEGKWTPYSAMLHTGLKVAESEARQDYRKGFLADWADRDWRLGMQMEALQPGETLSWYNSYPHEVDAQYGPDFLQTVGLKPHRKMGFLYQAVANKDGSVTLYSQTVDHSDSEAFNAVEAMLNFDPDADLDSLVGAYDGALYKKFGQRFYAGRSRADLRENAWEEIIQHRDLIEYYLHGIESLAKQNLPRTQLERAAKEHTYGVWAALKYRLETQYSPKVSRTVSFQIEQPHHQSISVVAMEVQQSFVRAQLNREVLAGCGGSIAMEQTSSNSLLSISPSEAFAEIFGEETTAGAESSYKFDKRMYCVVCQAPPSKSEQKSGAKKMCGPCGICKGCDTKIKAKNRGSYALAS